ncbi:MAG TPA: hypothetical protein VEJ86_10425 [Candidatus Binataceae bacterium]|nr:hypothetical protein [Candidatus Binataceae bacterium]
MSRPRVSPTRRPSRALAVALGAAIAVVGFASLMIRLEVIREGYRIAQLAAANAKLVEQNRTLRLRVAELSSHDRLRALAAKFNLGPARPRQVVMIP